MGFSSDLKPTVVLGSSMRQNIGATALFLVLFTGQSVIGNGSCNEVVSCDVVQGACMLTFVKTLEIEDEGVVDVVYTFGLLPPGK
ncbi:hypothetical protein E3N88_06564 [Mikania micrantha]|uniref:Uncharacterized protein n=1 Tax=Mikania micrantha TaxID=192012 RepID=A0A5N6PP40_9ASTR|nr:hypothetical protein E3N88_06564 [Mikania micrantha]